jgi:hypothetical protein
MKVHQLTAPNYVAYLAPDWFNTYRTGRHAATVGEDGYVAVGNQTLRLWQINALPPGTPIMVWLTSSGHFGCATQEDIAQEEEKQRAAEAEREARYAAAEQRDRERRNAMRAEAEAFNSRIKLPVQWDVGIKSVLSGLSANSWGDGRSRSTVEHIYLLEDLNVGRIQRKKDDFLCTSAGGSNGKRYSTTIERFHDGDGNKYQPKVTCKSCLALAQRWIQEDSDANNESR